MFAFFVIACATGASIAPSLAGRLEEEKKNTLTGTAAHLSSLGYPWLTGVALAASALFLLGSIVTDPEERASCPGHAHPQLSRVSPDEARLASADQIIVISS